MYKQNVEVSIIQEKLGFQDENIHVSAGNRMET